MKSIYSTTEVANLIGIHPNTVRLYEELGLITKPERRTNGYRIFTELHIIQFRIARLAFQVEVLQNGLRKQAVSVVKACAACEFDTAVQLTEAYLKQIGEEKQNAEKAIQIAEQLLSGNEPADDFQPVPSDLCLTRKQTADYLHITMDTLRNWERNGLLDIKRKQNGYRVYTSRDIRQLIIIKSLRCANYSLSAILRMLSVLAASPQTSLRDALDTPPPDDDIVTACDHLLSSLEQAKNNAEQIRLLISDLKKQE